MIKIALKFDGKLFNTVDNDFTIYTSITID